jgi:tRNA(Arg) A34 adenosine deaminase TadA
MKLKFVKLLRKLKNTSDHHQHKMACLIVNKNRVVSFGVNKVKTHPKSTARYSMLHAEIAALIGMAVEELNGCTAYIYREDRAGNTAMSRPCPACYEALKLVGIKKICYSTLSGFEEELIA